MRTLYLVLLFLSPIVFTTQMVMYAKLFYWRKSFQGRALMGQMAALNLVLWLNASFLIMTMMGLQRNGWWIFGASAVLAVLLWAGIWFCGVILRSREKPPHSSFT